MEKLFIKKIEQVIRVTHKNIISLIREKEKEKTIVKTECLKKLIKIEKTGQRISETEILNGKDG